MGGVQTSVSVVTAATAGAVTTATSSSDTSGSDNRTAQASAITRPAVEAGKKRETLLSCEPPATKRQARKKKKPEEKSR